MPRTGLSCLSPDSTSALQQKPVTCNAHGPQACACHSGGWDTSRLRGLPVTIPFLSSAPPTIWGSNETSEVAVMGGHPVQFLCEARGVPAPDIAWFKDGAPLPPSSEAVYTRGGRQLQLGRAQVSDAGVYTCKASNAVGVTEKTTRLEVYSEWPGIMAVSSGQLGWAEEGTLGHAGLCLTP
ncbi:Hemicentin-1 [Pteropus alecto]|uniref:Hemicentin-1 n=1 Tax=Pteropus alecto TaxID=9402 RepID=L5K6Y6_PTEAL|nr:Hemicentin-1 [Pteropus alecto]